MGDFRGIPTCACPTCGSRLLEITASFSPDTYEIEMYLLDNARCAMCQSHLTAPTPSPETLELMANLMTGDWNNAVESDLRSRREASGLIAAYLQWHIERGLRSLPLVERI